MKKVVFSKILLFLVLILSCFIFGSCMPHKMESISLILVQPEETEGYAASEYWLPLARFVVQKNYMREYSAKISLVKVSNRETEVFWEQEFDIGNTKEIFINFIDDVFVFKYDKYNGDTQIVQTSISEDDFLKNIFDEVSGVSFYEPANLYLDKPKKEMIFYFSNEMKGLKNNSRKIEDIDTDAVIVTIELLPDK